MNGRWLAIALAVPAAVALIAVPTPAPDPMPAAPSPPVFVGPPAPWGPTRIRGQKVDAASKARFSLPGGETFTGSGAEIPIVVVRGTAAGPVVCLTAGVHGDELNGVEIVRQVFEELDPASMEGMLIGLPVVNLHGFRSSSRYLPDRRDLNRYFPGAPTGSSASRIAHAVFRLLVERCDVLIDFHTASFHRTNLPQLRADLTDARSFAVAQRFAAGVVVHNYGMRGTLRRSATDAGIPAVTYEAGEPMRFETDEIAHGVRGVMNLLASYRMMPPLDEPVDEPEVFRRSRWVRTNHGGIFLATRGVGDRVQTGDVLGHVIDPVSNDRAVVEAPIDGRIIGMAIPQVVIPGFATFHIGIDAEVPESRVANGDVSDGVDALEQPE